MSNVSYSLAGPLEGQTEKITAACEEFLQEEKIRNFRYQVTWEESLVSRKGNSGLYLSANSEECKVSRD